MSFNGDAKQGLVGSEGKTFPTRGLMPKIETQAADFIRKNPNFDGRGVVVAILDTGVDPGAIGLQKTSDGKPKVVDIVDTTGSGDLDTSREVEGKADPADATAIIITGASGRTLRVSADWKNPSGKWRTGVKPEFELYPKGLVRRVKAEYAKKFNERARVRDAGLRAKLAELKAGSGDGGDERNAAVKDIEAQIAALKSLVSEYDYPGRLFDVVAYSDGTRWWVVVDTTEDGDLRGITPLTNYRDQNKYGTFSSVDLMNYTVNIYDQGNVVSIVTTCGSHGTHVAGIVAANFPDEPELNGVAPGAQIVSVKIGDTRLGSMETNTGMVRAIAAILNANCDVVNMSYGEPTATPNRGRFPELCRELVNKHSVIFVSSAGNAGPALSTVGAPGSTTSDLIGVGAYVSPDMMLVEYSMRESSPAIQYTWSSRGPAANGHAGVCITAPGGAFAPVPTWTLQKNTQMNGTSMSSPNAAGCVSLIVSGLKAEKIKFSPHSIRRALEATAKTIPNVEVFAQGCGLVQVSDAFTLIKRLNSTPSAPVETFAKFRVSVGAGEGVYMRDFGQLKPTDYRANIKPVFPEEFANEDKQSFMARVVLKSTAPLWVQSAKHLVLHHGGGGFDFRVDPTDLAAGSYFAEILGLDAKDFGKGPLFRVPITVLVPEKKQEALGVRYRFPKLTFRSGQIYRKYLAVPDNATWARIRLRAQNIDTMRKFMLAAMWLGNQEGYRDHVLDKFFRLKDDSTASACIEVRQGRTLEVVVAHYWSSLGACTVDVDVDFYGISATPGSLASLSDPDVMRADVSSLVDWGLEPSASLTKVRTQLRPIKSSIQPLPRGPRDTLPQGRQIYEVILTYAITIPAKGKAKPTFPYLNGRLYESDFGAQLWMLYDSNKKNIASGDAWPDATKLNKGKYTLKLQVRHSNVAKLEPLKDLVMVLERPLSKPISLSAHRTHTGAVTGSQRLSKVSIARGATIPVFWKLSGLSKAKGISPGDSLIGTATYGKSENGSTDPIKYPVRAVVPPTAVPAKKQSAEETAGPSKKSGDEKKGAADKPADSKSGDGEDEIVKGIRDATIAFIKKQKGADALRKVVKSDAFTGIVRSSGSDPAVLDLQLWVAQELKENEVAAADAVIAAIDADTIAQFYGKKRTPEDEKSKEGKKRAKEISKKKARLVKALLAKAEAVERKIKGQFKFPAEASSAPEQDRKAFEAIYQDLARWEAEKSDKKRMGPLLQTRYMLKGQLGLALKATLGDVTNATTGAPDRKAVTRKEKLLEALKWDEVLEFSKLWSQHAFPKNYRPF